MKRYTSKKVVTSDLELSELSCDKCGKTARGKHDILWSDITTINVCFGFGSKRDGDTWIIDLCDDCLDKVAGDINKIETGV